MRCRSCQTELIEGKGFCHACGARASSGCDRCGSPLEPEYRFCPDCGAPVSLQLRPDEPRHAAAVESAARPVMDAEGERFSRLARHIPQAVAEKIRQAGAEVGERKRVTVLFCDLVGSTAIAEELDPEEYRELLEPYLELVFEEVYRLEGVVNQLSGDGLMALFGAPISYENDSERAVRAALAIQRALSELGPRAGGRELSARIGVHTGMVVAGTVGNDLKMDYTAIGDTTNLAARLQTLAAPGSILVSDATHRFVRDTFHTRPLGPFEVKGKRKPVEAYEVLGLSEVLTPMSIARSEGLTPLVGRVEQLAQLHSCYQRSRGRLGQVVAVVGPAGSGKSRLVYEFKQQLQQDEVSLFEARCSSLTQGMPYAPWVSMLQRYFGIVPGEEAEESRRKIEKGLASLGSSEEDIARDLHAMLSLPDLETGAEEQKLRSFAVVAALVKLAAVRVPVLVIVEDLHWIDDASREMLELSISEFEQGRSMLLVTHRPQYLPAWKSVAALTQLHLSPLSDEEGAEIVRARAGGPLPVELEERVLAKGEGNPLFLEELTKTLVEEGTLVSTSGRVELTRPVEDIRIPDTVHELLEARLDRLSRSAKRVAQIASVFGRQFRRSQLAALASGEQIDVDRELEELERLGIIHRKLGMDKDEFRFGESLTQEVAYGALLLRERRTLHQRVGELFEAADGESRARLPLLAHHFARSEDRGKGTRLLLQAAAEAAALPSYGDAARLYREAWGLAEVTLSESQGEDESLLESVLEASAGVAHVGLVYGGEREEQHRAARRGVELAQQLDSREALADLLSTRGLLVIDSRGGDFDEGRALIEEGLDVARRAGNEQSAARISRTLGWALALDGRFEDARRKTEGALLELEKLYGKGGSANAYLTALFFRNRVLFEADEFGVVEPRMRETYELAQEHNNRTVQSGCAAVLSTLEFARGNSSEAVRWVELDLRMADQIENVSAARSMRAVRLAVRAESGERMADPAEPERIEESLRSGELPINVDLIVEALLASGELERARRVAEGSSGRGGGRVREARGQVSLGLVSLAGDPSEWGNAERCFDEALGLATRLGARSVRAKALLGRAQLAALRGELDARDRDGSASAAIFRELGMGRYEKRARTLLAESSSTLRAR